MATSAPVRIALVGCGAVAERGHLPAIARTPGAVLSLLVDADRARAEALAAAAGHPAVAGSWLDVPGRADAAIIALPHALHAAAAVALLERGVHVLVEKPMATSTADCDRMLAAARAGGAVLAVGLMRRYLGSTRLARRVLDQGLLGPLRRFDVREGGAYTWPAHSDAFLRRERSGGGVLLDTGAHVLDALLHWLGSDGDGAEVSYLDDAAGGVEADCTVRLRLPGGAEGVVHLSRTRTLRNTARFFCERGELEVGLRDERAVLRLAGEPPLGLDGVAAGPGGTPPTIPDLLAAQLADWLGALRGGGAPGVDGAEGRRSVALIERCYGQREPLAPAWAAPPARRGPERPLAGRRVLVTGGTGFLGGRLVERLVAEQGAEVRVLVRDVRRAVRLARLPVELAPGDTGDADAVARAAAGCDLVFDCAFDAAAGPALLPRAVAAAEAIAAAVQHHGIRRLVHVGSISAYATGGEEIDEASALGPRHPYGRAKLAAQERLLSAGRADSLPVVVVQPTVVYGPFCRPWTLAPVEQLRSGELVLVDGGACNAVYVDDVVDALLAAALRPAVEGEAILVSGAAPVTWREFYGAFEAMLAMQRVRPTDREEVERHLASGGAAGGGYAGALDSTVAQLGRWLRDPRAWRGLYGLPLVRDAYGWVERALPIDLKALVKERLVAAPPAAGSPPGGTDPGAPRHWPSPERLELWSAPSRVRIDKARRLLDYQPAFDLTAGMSRTAAFVRWYYDL